MDKKKIILGIIIIIIGIAEFVYAYTTKVVPITTNAIFTLVFLGGGGKVVYDGIKGK